MRAGSAERLRSWPTPIMATAVAAALLLASCTPTSHTTRSGAGSTHGGSVISLNNITTLKSLFDRDGGRPRLVLIFSPT